MGFCKDILLNLSFDYSSDFKKSSIEEITFENIWKTINCYIVLKISIEFIQLKF